MALKGNLLPTTGVGSLPHENISDAIDFSLKHDIPFLPELTKLDGFMNESKKNSCLDEFIKNTTSSNVRKIQFPSPLINSNTKIQSLENTITFIDSPIIEDYEKLKRIVQGKGLHTCSKINLNEIKKLGITHLSFDAELIESAPSYFLEELIKNNITPVVGIINTANSDIALVSSIKDWKKAIAKYSISCWLSYGCGLAKHSIDQSEDAFQRLISIRSEILQLH
jgi:hypothetical protein